MKLIPCQQCGANLRPHFLKDGACNGCRNPETVVPALVRATVHWFDNLSQEGMIRLADGSCVYVNNDPVYGCRLMDGVMLDLKSGQPVFVEVFEDTTFRQVSKLVVDYGREKAGAQ